MSILKEYRLYRDDEAALVGIAVRFDDGNGPLWVWSATGDVAERNVPSVSAYRLFHCSEPMPKWHINATLQQWEVAGVITSMERIGILCALIAEADKVSQFWQARGEAIPTAEELFRRLQESQDERM